MRRIRRRGTTLIELLIASSIMLLIMGSITAILLAGFSYVRTNEKALDTQRNVLLVLTRLGQEVQQSDYNCVEFGASETPPRSGITFVSPFSNHTDPALHLSESFQTDPKGNMAFQSYICYYLDIASHKLYRNEVNYNVYDLAAADTSPPVKGNTHLCLASDRKAPLLVAWWEGATAMPGTTVPPPATATQVADNIQAFNITSSSPGTGSAVVNISISAGDEQHGPNDKESFFFTLITTVSPRN